MMNLKANRRKMTPFKLLALGAFISFSACASSPEARLYLMKNANGPVISQTNSLASSQLGSQVSILVGPIVMPEYLRRPEVVYRSDTHNITVNEYDRWAESLERNMTSVITSNLATHLGTDRAFDYYANFSTKPDFNVRLNVTEFGRISRDTVSLSVSWELAGRSGQQSQLYSENIKTTINYSGESEGDENIGEVSHVIAAMNEALNELSLTIANQIASGSPRI